jgi:hypothetical protein
MSPQEKAAELILLKERYMVPLYLREFLENLSKLLGLHFL